MATSFNIPQWVTDHRTIWNKKPNLQHYYKNFIFDPVIQELVTGNTLEIGSGPGFFSEYYPNVTPSDITQTTPETVVSDVQNQIFPLESFSNIVGIDVLHHITSPLKALQECNRILKPGGRIILIEPWTTPFGYFFYKYFHHEDCFYPDDPWQQPFAHDKDPMEGNAAIPYVLFVKQKKFFEENFLSSLKLTKVYPFAFLSYLITGGFSKVGLPIACVDTFAWIEKKFPKFLRNFLSVRALIVIQKEQLPSLPISSNA